MVREYLEKDLPEINHLLEIFQYQLTSKSLKNAFTKIAVFEDKNILGVIVYKFIYDRIEIDYIAVDEKNRKKGIGTALINFVIENNVINNLTLEVRCSNKTAIEFYESNKFEIAAVRKNYYSNEDGYLMIRKIGD